MQARGDPVSDHAGGEGAGGVVLAAAVDGPAEDQADAVGRPRSRLSRMTCSKKIRPDTGLSSIWVRENSACRMEMSTGSPRSGRRG